MLPAAGIKLIATLCLVLQVWVGVVAGGAMICMRPVNIVLPAADECCKDCCKQEKHKPAPPPQCPPSCSCCLVVPAADQPTPVVTRTELERAVSWAVAPVLVAMLPPRRDDVESLGLGVPPPDRPVCPSDLGRLTTRLNL